MKGDNSNLYDEITHALQQASGFSDFKNVNQFHKKVDFTYLGLSTPQFRVLMKPYNSKIKSLSTNEAIALAHNLYKAHVLEYASAATHILAQHKKEITPKQLPKLDEMFDEFRSWSTTDDICIT